MSRHLIRAISIAGLIMGSNPAPVAAQSAEASADSAAIEIVLQARTEPRSPLPWPKFDIRREILLVPVFPGGPTVLAGDDSPPPEYLVSPRATGVLVRPGPPPDSLSGLQLARDWNGRSAMGTVVTLGSLTSALGANVLVHEAFHSFQRRASGGAGAPMIPPTSNDQLLALGVLEGQALLATQQPGGTPSHRMIERALQIRALRCAALGEACARLRSLEAYEGSARYVEVLSLDGREAVAAGLHGDTTSAFSVHRPTRGTLARAHAYSTGALWLALLHALRVPDWEQAVALRWREATAPAPDELVARHLGWRSDTVTTQSMLDTPEGQRALDYVRTLPVRADSSDATSPEVLSARDNGRKSIRVIIPGDVQVSMSSVALPNGGREVRLRMGQDLLVLVRSDRQLRFDVSADIRGRAAEVAGRQFPLDAEGSAEGALVLELPEITARFTRATIRVGRDEITVTYVPDRLPR